MAAQSLDPPPVGPKIPGAGAGCGTDMDSLFFIVCQQLQIIDKAKDHGGELDSQIGVCGLDDGGAWCGLEHLAESLQGLPTRANA